MLKTTAIVFMAMIVVSVAICLWDWYCYYHVRPKEGLKDVERKIHEIEAEIEEHQFDADYPLKTSYDLWDYWESEKIRIGEWNKRHPNDQL